MAVKGKDEFDELAAIIDDSLQSGGSHDRRFEYKMSDDESNIYYQ